MKIHYIDEYDETLLSVDGTFVPRVGDIVPIDGEEYRVVEVIWNPVTEIAAVGLNQNKIKKTEPAANDVSTRLNEINRAIVDLNKRQDASDKKSRSLNEQLVSVRTHIRSIPKPKPTQDNR